jgi:CRISPR associated protein Csm6
MRSWITTVGPSPFAVINTFWAAAERDHWVPSRIYLIYEDHTKGSLPGISCVMEKIVLEYGGKKPEIFCKSIDEDDLGDVFKTYETIINEERELGNKIAIDITPGRKYMSAFSLYAGLKGGTIDKIYYIHIRGRKYMNLPYPMIPTPYCNLEDIVSIGGVYE